MPLLAVAMMAGYLTGSPVQAATFGHSRLVSAVGEPLRITIPVTELSAAEAESLRIFPAPASAWANASLTPPVDVTTLQTRLTDGYTPGSRVLQVWSDQVFNKPIADLLLDIHTSSGVQRYQVSLLARGGASAVQTPVVVSTPDRRDQSAAKQPDIIDQPPVLIRRGDTMFSVAQRHAVSGVTVYQMMMALQRANPDAFIHQNINLVIAGARLVMPDMDALTAISDREARRLFHEQVVAFNAYRQGRGPLVAGDPAPDQPIAQPAPDVIPTDGISNIPESRVAGGDHLKLSSGRATGAATAASPSADSTTQAPAPVGGQDTSVSVAGTAGTGHGTEGGAAQSMTAPINKPAHAATSAAVSNSTPGVDSSPVADLPSSPAGPGNDVSGDRATGPAVGRATGPAAGDVTGTANSASGSGDGTTDVANPAQGPTRDTAEPTSDGHPPVGDGSEADDAVAHRKAVEDAQMRVSMLEENVKNLNRALQSQGEAAIDVVVDGAIGLRQSLTDVATAVTDATIGDEDDSDASPSEQKGSLTTTQNRQDTTTANMMESITTWVQANLIGVIAAALALVVLIVVWILRRANIAQSSGHETVTPEMVKEKLAKIDLDLSEPTVGDTTRSS